MNLTLENLLFERQFEGKLSFRLSIPRYEVLSGQKIWIRGQSGVGKTTLLRLIAGLLTPHQGHVYLGEKSLSGLTSSQRDRVRADEMGFVYQDFNLVPYLTVKENILMPLHLSSVRKKRFRSIHSHPLKAVTHMLDQLHLSHHLLNRKPKQLSIGQQQRVAILRAMMGSPRILLADEPIASLDTQAREAFMTFLKSQCQAYETTLFFVSHEQGEVAYFDKTVDICDWSQRC